jgi:hypothetical protein
MATLPSAKAGQHPRYPSGQRLCCANCGSEIEVISPCSCDPPRQVFRCCDRDMEPSTGRDVHLGDE